MIAFESLAFRLEYEGRGPFWCPDTMRQVIRQCRKLTPHWKRDEIGQGCSSFLEHYCANAQCPFDVKQFDAYLTRGENPNWKFGFKSKTDIETELGLTWSPLYREQFAMLLNADRGFCVRAYLARGLAESRTEILFDAARSELLAEARSWAAFGTL